MSNTETDAKLVPKRARGARKAPDAGGPRIIFHRGSLQIARRSLSAQAQAVRKLAREIGHEFNAAINAILRTKGRVIVSGLGKSGLVGQKISATFSSTGTASFFLHPVEAFQERARAC